MPNWGDFQEQGFNFTEKDIKPFESDVIQIYRDSQKHLESELEKVYATLAGISPDDSGYYNELVKENRLTDLLNDLSKSYTSFSTRAGRKTVTSSNVGITNNYYRQLYASAWTGAQFTVLPEQLVELAVLGTNEAWTKYTKEIEKKFGAASFYQPKEGTLSAILKKNNAQDIAKLRQTITSGLIEGKSYAKMIDSVKDITGRELIKEGKKVLTGAKAKAMNVLRTEGTRIMNSGAFAQSNQLLAQGVDVLKEWLATLDMLTRTRHASLDGQRQPIEKPFKSGGDSAMYPGDFGTVKMNARCRCSYINIIPGFEPDTRAGRNPVTGKTEIFSWRNYDEWAKNNGLIRTSSGKMIFKGE